MLGDERLEVADQLGARTGDELGLDPFFDGCDAELVEAHRLRPRERLVGEIRERRPADERECLPQQLGGALRSVRGTRLAQQALESRRVDLLRVEPEEVAARVRLDRVLAEHLAQLRDVHLKRGARGRGRCRAPDRLCELLGREHAVRPEQERREQPPLPGP